MRRKNPLHMKRVSHALSLFGALVASLLPSSPASARDAAVELKTPQAVIRRWVDAMGGESAVRRNTNRVTVGSLDLPAMGAAVTLTMVAQAPDRRVTSINIPGFGDMKSGFDGKEGWRTNPQTGAVDEVTGDQLAQEKVEADYWMLVELEKRFPALELKAAEKVGDRDCYVVDAVAPGAKPDRFFFDKETGLLVRRDAEALTPIGKLATETLFEDYREVNGIKVAFTVRRTKPEALGFVFKTTSMKFNTAVDDAQFRKPKAGKP